MWDAIQFLLPPFVACITIIILPGYLGIHVLEREIIFIDIAMAQFAAVGSTIAHIVWHADEHSFVAYIASLSLTLIAAAFFTKVKKRVTQIPQEAVIGVSYAVAAALAIFIIAMAAGSDVHMEHMLTGSILWAKWPDIITCIVIFSVIGLFHYFFREKFKRVSLEYKKARDEGMRVELWDFLFYATLGIVVTHSVHIAGVLVVFAFLVIPATISAMFTDRWSKRVLIAYGLTIGASILGLIFSYVADFSAGPSVVTLLGISLIVTSLLKRKIPRPASDG